MLRARNICANKDSDMYMQAKNFCAIRLCSDPYVDKILVLPPQITG